MIFYVKMAGDINQQEVCCMSFSPVKLKLSLPNDGRYKTNQTK